LTDGSGVDVPFPYHDSDHKLPSGDCALLRGSLNVVEGWLILNGFSNTAKKASDIKNKMNFRSCYFEETSTNKAYIAHQISADDGKLSEARWDIYADEGGMVAFIAYQSNSITFDEYKKLLDSQSRSSGEWNGNVVREISFYNQMFTWPQRTIVGFPMFGNKKERIYGVNSFIPTINCHLDYGDYLKIDYPGFSDAMTQTNKGDPMVGKFVPLVPPNLFSLKNTVIEVKPTHIVPHALFVPCCGISALDEITLKKLYTKWVLLKCDSSRIWHPSSSQDPYGFEVVANSLMNQVNYPGADNGRYIFETLSSAYISFSIYEGLEHYDDNRTFYYFARQVKDYNSKVSDVLNYAYHGD